MYNVHALVIGTISVIEIPLERCLSLWRLDKKKNDWKLSISNILPSHICLLKLRYCCLIEARLHMYLIYMGGWIQCNPSGYTHSQYYKVTNTDFAKLCSTLSFQCTQLIILYEARIRQQPHIVIVMRICTYTITHFI